MMMMTLHEAAHRVIIGLISSQFHTPLRFQENH